MALQSAIEVVEEIKQAMVGRGGAPIEVRLPDGSAHSVHSIEVDQDGVLLVVLETENHPDQAKMWRQKALRSERRAAAANKENRLLMDKVRDLTMRNFALQRIMDDPSTLSGYRVRYEKAREALNIIRDIVTRGESGLPVEEPARLHPVEVPEYLRVKPKEV